MSLVSLRRAPVAVAPVGLPVAGVPASPKLAPALLVGEHFAVALAYLICGAVGLLLVAPELAQGAFLAPRVVAVVHLFTLGFIMLSIFGALCQFLPVAVGRSIWSFKLAHATFAFHAAGVAGLVVGLILGHRALLFAGALALSIAFVSAGINLVATLARAEQRDLTFWALSAASVSLFATPIYGLMLAIFVHHGGLTSPFVFIAHHAHIAVVGIVLLVMVGVAHRLMPMFLLTHGVPERFGWAAIGLLFSSTLLLLCHGALPSLMEGMFGRVIDYAALALGGGGVVALVLQASLFYRHRTRKALDSGMSLAAAALLSLLIATALAPFALTLGLSNVHLLTTYYIVLLGAITLFVAAHYYKIVPFLVWNHRFGPLLGKQKVPKVTELYSKRLGYVNAVSFALGLIALACGAFLGQLSLMRVGALAFIVAAVLEALVLARVARRTTS